MGCENKDWRELSDTELIGQVRKLEFQVKLGNNSLVNLMFLEDQLEVRGADGLEELLVRDKQEVDAYVGALGEVVRRMDTGIKAFRKKHSQ